MFRKNASGSADPHDNVRPVRSNRMEMPGMQHARLHLEMTGEWPLKLDFMPMAAQTV